MIENSPGQTLAKLLYADLFRTAVRASRGPYPWPLDDGAVVLAGCRFLYKLFFD